MLHLCLLKTATNKQSLYKKLEHPPLWNSKLQEHYRLGLQIPLPWPHSLPLSWISLPSPLLWNSSLERLYRLGPPLPRPWPLPVTASLFLDFTFGSTSTSSVSRGKLDIFYFGRIKYRMLFPRILNVSSCTGSLFFRVIFTALRCVFILTSTPVIVPWTCVPFFNSVVTFSWLDFIQNLTSFILAALSPFRPDSTRDLTTDRRGPAYEWPETLRLSSIKS